MILKSKLKKWGWKIAAGVVTLLILLGFILAIILPKEKSEAVIVAAIDAQGKLADNAKEHEVRIAVAETKHSEGKRVLEEKLAEIDAEPDSLRRRKALIAMHRELL